MVCRDIVMASPECSNQHSISAFCANLIWKTKKTSFYVVFGPSGKRAGLHVPFKNGNTLLDDSWFLRGVLLVCSVKFCFHM
jgi:hypothetical protein